MKTIKKILLGLLIVLLLLVGALAAVPFLFRDQLIETVRTEVNERINAEVTFSDVDISLLRSFPDLNLAFTELAITGVDTFAGLPLLRATGAAVDLDLMSVIWGGSNVQINGITMNEPELRILILPNGLANYDIAKTTTAEEPEDTTDEAAIQFALESYQIEDGYFLYDDRASEIYLELTGLDHTGTGNFTLEEFDLDTESQVASLTYAQSGVTYLDKAQAILDAVFNINTATSTYTLKDNELLLNELVLNFDGFVALPNEEDIQVDFSFNAPANDFRQLWSIVPAAYTNSYANVSTQGQFTLDGFVKGIYNGEREVYPSFAINSRVDNGRVQYPDLPLPVQNILADVRINSPSEALDDMVIEVPNLSLQVGQDPVKAQFRLATPISDPQVAATVQGVIDLEQWARAFPLEDVEELSGRIAADIDIDTRASTLEAGRYGDVRMAGDLSVTDLNYRSAGLPPVKILRAIADFTPQAVRLTDFSANLGRSDLRATGNIQNILAYISPKMTMRGDLEFRSNFFAADEWVPAEEPEQPLTPAELAAAEPGVAESTEVFDRFDFRVSGFAREITYDTYQLRDSEVNGRVTANRLELDRVSTQIGETRLAGSGTILNAFDYAFYDGVLGGELQLSSPFFNLDDFMTETPETTSSGTTATESAVIPVPENINLVANVKADRVKYTDVNLNDLTGKIYVREERVIVEDGTAAALGGTIDFSGAYDTSEPGDPGFEFHYNMQNLDFRNTFATLNTFAALAPIGKFIEGRLNTDLIISGKLGQDLFPKLSTIDAQGFLQTLNAHLASGFKPISAIGNALNIKELSNSLDLQNVKSWFTVEDGTVTVEPFDVQLGNARMLVQGTHGLTNEMNYQIQAAVPRQMIEGNIVGSAVVRGLSQLSAQAQKLGLNIEPGDTLNLAIQLTGSLTEPKVNFNLVGTGGGSSGFAESAGAGLAGALQDEASSRIDSARQEARTQIDSATGRVREAVDQTLDSARAAARDQAAALEQQAKDRVREAIGLPRDSTRRDSTATGNPVEEIKKSAEDIKKELEKFNPFRKKKSGGGG
jgi:uncharacterized protein involved in outer membrane biogenesis/vacuolar-type H+-ATPase subunit H